MRERIRRDRGRRADQVVGVNRYTEAERVAAAGGGDGGILTGRPGGRAEQRERRLCAGARDRDQVAVDAALRRARASGALGREQHHGGDRSRAARAGVTTGEWAGSAARACSASIRAAHRRRARPASPGPTASRRCEQLRDEVDSRARSAVGGRLQASSSASPASTGTTTAPSRSRCAARDAGMDVVYAGHPPDARDRSPPSALRRGRPRRRPVDPERARTRRAGPRRMMRGAARFTRAAGRR